MCETQNHVIHVSRSLGSTRFIKAARLHVAGEGHAVAKVFVNPEPNYRVDKHRREVITVAARLRHASHCCPFNDVIVTSRSCILLRQFAKETLYDRLSARPYLTYTEKLWIAYQALKGLEQCHSQKVYHGDLKCENVLISSDNWVMLTDFATFKPTLLPYDNPSDYTFFYDTSRRRTCYIAPERFEAADTIVKGADADPSVQKENILPAADVFALGCVLVEMFGDGRAPFAFSEMLTFRKRNKGGVGKRVQALLQSLQLSSELARMLEQMLDRRPESRPTAAQLLASFTGKVFPGSFPQKLWPYAQSMAQRPILTPDARIDKLVNDCARLLADCEGSDTAILVLSWCTSQCRAVRTVTSRLVSIHLLYCIAAHVTAEAVCDRILPYLTSFLCDANARVRAAAVTTITKCLRDLDALPPADARLFVDYLLPKLSRLASDPSIIVRMTLARNAAALCTDAQRLFERASRCKRRLTDSTLLADSAQLDASQHDVLSAEEQRALRLAFQDLLFSLLCGDNAVKLTLVSSGLKQLCEFFGKTATSDVILSHMITFVNDKNDWRCRCAFYEKVPTVAQCIGWQSTLLLKPLLAQRHTLCDLLKDVSPLLVHPNRAVRLALAKLLEASQASLNVADVHCKVMPLFMPYLAQTLVKFDNPSLTIRCARRPLARAVWQLSLSSAHTADLMDYLSDELLLRRLDSTNAGAQSAAGVAPRQQHASTKPAVASLYGMLKNAGLSHQDEAAYWALRDVLVRLREKQLASLSPNSSGCGLVVLRPRADASGAQIWPGRSADLAMHRVTLEKRKLRQVEHEMKAAMVDWQPPGGVAATAAQILPPDAPIEQRATAVEGANVNATVEEASEAADVFDEAVSIDVDKVVFSDRPVLSCDAAVNALIEHKRDQWLSDGATLDAPEDEGDVDNAPTSSQCTFSGHLVAHLRQHSKAVYRLAAHPDGRYLLSCSADGRVLLWDGRRFEGRSLATKAAAVYGAFDTHRVRGMCALRDGERFACAADTGQVHVVPFGDMRQAEVSFVTDPYLDGFVHSLYSWSDGGSTEPLVGLTQHGSVLAWDVRAPSSVPIWRWRHNDHHGLVSAMAVDPTEARWLCTGTVSGKMILWDVRFQLPVNTVSHPNGRCVSRLWAESASAGARSASAALWCSVVGNGELARWDLETGQRTCALWPSDNPPLSYGKTSTLATTAMCELPNTFGRRVGGHNSTIDSWPSSTIYTGDTAAVLRAWNPNLTRNSGVLAAPPSNRPLASASLAFRLSHAPAAGGSLSHGGRQQVRKVYNQHSVDGVSVLCETDLPPSGTGDATDALTAGAAVLADAAVSMDGWHTDAITDMITFNAAGRYFVATAGADAIVNVWM